MFKLTWRDKEMSELNGLNSLRARYGYDKLTNWGITQKDYDNTMGDKVNVRGKEATGYANPLLRIREDKLRSMKRALYNSYQSAVIQFDKDDRELHFRCLINHDKLKVDYEDKILSIPFRQVPVEYEGNRQMTLEEKMVDTGTKGTFLDEAGNPVLDTNGDIIQQYRVKPGDTFKWISGNQGYMPDSYWIIFLQYSQETAYFRGQIRKADDIIQIIPIGEDGEPGEPLFYHGWTVGPNQEDQIWNVKKGVVWNDLYYSKLLYITKDEYTSAYFKRFDRIIINGDSWQIAAYNDNYGTTNKNSTGGMIRVALKETYTSTNEVIKNMQEEYNTAVATTAEYEIIGPSKVQSYDVVVYSAPDGNDTWTIVNENSIPVRQIENTSEKLKLEIGQVAVSSSFKIVYGSTQLPVTVKPFK